MGKKRKAAGAQFSWRNEPGKQLTSSPKVRVKPLHRGMYEKGYVTADMVAVMLGVHFSTVLRWGRKGYLETSRLHGQYFLERAAVAVFIRREQPDLEKLKSIDLDDWGGIFCIDTDDGETYLRTEAA